MNIRRGNHRDLLSVGTPFDRPQLAGIIDARAFFASRGIHDPHPLAHITVIDGRCRRHAEGQSIARPLILHFGELDHTTPPELLQGQILPAIAGNSNVQSFVYPKMVHAFANHRRPDTYDAEVTKVADTRTFAHFRKWLEPERRRATA